MIKYVDDGRLHGWYYQSKEGFYFGDGSKEMAERIKNEWEEYVC